MATFELGGRAAERTHEAAEAAAVDCRKLKEECIIALKVYDSCRQQDCLTEEELGPAKAAENITIAGTEYRAGEIIEPPAAAADVTIDRLRVRRVTIADKEQCSFKPGYWDITLNYVFEYSLTFRNGEGCFIGTIRAVSTFSKRVSLFGSIGTDIVISTDLFSHHGSGNVVLDAEPFVFVEAKAVPLDAKIIYSRSNGCTELRASHVAVTIGLFTIIKLFRLVQLSVESRGFCVPPECPEVSPFNPCDFFDSIDFPFDIFSPPQKPEFMASLGNISGAPDWRCCDK